MCDKYDTKSIDLRIAPVDITVHVVVSMVITLLRPRNIKRLKSEIPSHISGITPDIRRVAIQQIYVQFVEYHVIN